MRKDSKNHKMDVLGLTDTDVVHQQTLSIQEHNADTKYKMLAKNTFGNGTVHCPGYFNNKTNFIIGERNSIMIIDKGLKIKEKNISEIQDFDFILYPIPCLNMDTNFQLDFKFNDKIETIQLTFEFGERIGRYLANPEMLDIRTGFLSVFVDTKNGLSLNKNILINSNPNFVLGILKGYHTECNTHGLYILPNVNLYTFTTILNYLGASYSIRNSKNNTKKVYIQLSDVFSSILPSIFYKNEAYLIADKQVKLFKRYQIAEKLDDFNETSSILSNINSGRILLVPFNSIELKELDSDDRVYDLTSERLDATNYAMNFTPFLKNSDGDILATSGIFTKKALVDSEEFSPDHKEYYKDLNEGNINQWIADDAILGLYNATK